MPQFQFNEDGQWHDFAPEGGVGLKAGPWFPFLQLHRSEDDSLLGRGGDCLSNHRVESGDSIGGLEPAGWKCYKDGKIKNGEPHLRFRALGAAFKHSQSLEEGDVWRMQLTRSRHH